MCILLFSFSYLFHFSVHTSAKESRCKQCREAPRDNSGFDSFSVRLVFVSCRPFRIWFIVEIPDNGDKFGQLRQNRTKTLVLSIQYIATKSDKNNCDKIGQKHKYSVFRWAPSTLPSWSKRLSPEWWRRENGRKRACAFSTRGPTEWCGQLRCYD